MRIMSVVGARPQFIKLKPISDQLANLNHEHIIVNTGQHYDYNMSKIFFEGLTIPQPNFNLEVGSGSHAQQTGAMLVRTEEKILKFSPDWILVYGDTNTTAAASLAAAKTHIPVAHIEAGLRSFNRLMPEEINRILSDHISNLLFAPTLLAMNNLKNEGLYQKAKLVGDVMADLIYSLDFETNTDIELPKTDYVVATIHRASNTDDLDQLHKIFESLGKVQYQIIVVTHPRLAFALKNLKLQKKFNNIEFKEPVGYLHMMGLLKKSKGVITDSGGLQKEAYLLGVPCITVRSETEWPETFEGNMNVLDPNAEELNNLINRKTLVSDNKPFGNGDAAKNIISFLEQYEIGEST
jgi:UDP-N-acetylglucosamine 2-epimerase (non-hydrolysing)